MQPTPIAPNSDADVRLAAFYGRVSGPDDVSIDIQLAICREFAERDGYRIPSGHDFIFQDVNVSGSTLSRGGFDRLKKVVTSDQAQFDRLYCRESARFGRWDDPRQYDYHAVLFENHGVAIYFCNGEKRPDYTESVDVGLYITQKLTNVKDAQERFELKMKMRRARRHYAKEGFYPNGSIPYGFEKVLVDTRTKEVVRVVPRGERIRIDGCRYMIRLLEGRECDAIRFIFDSVEQGLPLSRIAIELNRLGFLPPRKRRWFHARVSKIARDPIYMGTLAWAHHQRRTDLKNPPPAKLDGQEVLVIPGFIKNPPITEDQFFRVQAILDGKNTLWTKRRACTPKYLFAGLIRCPVCGSLYSGSRQGRTNRRIYRHNGSINSSEKIRTCPEFRRGIRCDDLDAFLHTQIRNVLADPELEKRVRAQIRCSLEGENTHTARERIRKQKKTIDKKRNQLKVHKAILEKAETEEAATTVLSVINSITKEIEGMEEQLKESQSKQLALEAHLEHEAQIIADRLSLLQQLDSDSFQVQRDVVLHIVESIHARATTKEAVIALRYK